MITFSSHQTRPPAALRCPRAHRDVGLRLQFPFAVLAAICLLLTSCRPAEPASDQPDVNAMIDTYPHLSVPRIEDFELTGDGSNPAWERAPWAALKPAADNAHAYTARVKMLYSSSGLYMLFDGTDSLISASLEGDYLELWTEDVYEAFFWTDSRYPVYFEYEISPLGYELPLIIPNFEGEFLGWIPWRYEGERRTRKAVHVRDGQMISGSPTSGWSAEVFVPYQLLQPLQQVPPEPGSTWRANFYRNDYDNDGQSSWAWSPTSGNYHLYEEFGTLQFE